MAGKTQPRKVILGRVVKGAGLHRKLVPGEILEGLTEETARTLDSLGITEPVKKTKLKPLEGPPDRPEGDGDGETGGGEEV